MAVLGLLGVFIERFAYRPLRNAPRLAPLITAIGVSFILQNVVQRARRPVPDELAEDLPGHWRFDDRWARRSPSSDLFIIVVASS